ncbi:hypothetical protein [Patulibacter sp. SYSU D01012]|uniref:hypothetical protein n=1 Tax=Patulibacter sp. SYSU D01012 TaxID=2817381 RepID=UPI001B31741D|nr:hypothetical protein [Patulibacter sp. SYSU D01012]
MPFTVPRSTPSGAQRRHPLAVAAVLLTLAAGAAGASGAAPAPAHAAEGYGITDFVAGVVTDEDADRNDASKYFTAAGGRPTFGVTEFTFATDPPPADMADEDGEPKGNTKDIEVDVPAGLTPNPTAFPTCTNQQLSNMDLVLNEEQTAGFPRTGPEGWCPPASQIGVQYLRVKGTISGFVRTTLTVKLPLYNMERGRDQVGRFAFNPRMAPLSFVLDGNLDRVDVVGGVRPSDSGLFFRISDLPKDPAVIWSKLVFWGVPGDPSHDADRRAAGLKLPGTTEFILDPDGYPGGVAVDDRTTAFLSNPTSCAGKQTTYLRTESYDGDRAATEYTTPVGASGCDAVPFAPKVSFGESALQADAPTPLSVRLDVPQSQDAGDLATAHVKRVALTLPPGMTISPSAANGLEVCSDDQLAAGTIRPVACPAASKVGRTTITSPVLDDPLEGAIYVGEPKPGQRYRLFLVAEGRGVTIRLKGDVQADPDTGQLTAVFDDNPQLPFSRLRLDFDGGARAIVASPQTCGTAEARGTMSPWSGAAAVPVAAGARVEGCTGHAFAPTLGARSGNAVAGRYAPLQVGFGRPDGQQFLSGVSVKLPPGMTAKVKGVPQCTDAQIATLSCPATSRLGSVTVNAGPGARPYALSGDVYFTGGYRGAPYGMVVMVRAIAGPYDLGTVVVRQALHIDPDTAQVTVASDPLPQVVGGVQLRLRDLALTIDRTNFVRNPTSCAPARIHAGLTSAEGAQAGPVADLAFTGCDRLAFGPRVSLRLDNRRATRKLDAQRLTVKVKQSESEAGIRSTRVTLPKALALSAKNAKGLCKPEEAKADRCPKASIVGYASADTTILERPLKGPVYFVEGLRTTADGRQVKTLPNLYIPLRGEVTVKLRATTDVRDGRLVTTLPAIPDAPIRTFAMTINGGKHGILQATQDVCTGRAPRADVRFGGYAGRTVDRTAALRRACRAGR